MAKMFVTLACILTTCSACKDNSSGRVLPQPGNSTLPAATTYPNPAPAGIYDPTKPEPFPVYDLAAGWRANPANPWQAHDDHSTPQALSFDLGVLPRPDQGTDAESWRDLRFNHVFCQVIGEKDVAINCDKGFKKENLTVAGKKLFVLHYFGVQGDLNMPVSEVFWEGTNSPEALVIQGDFQKSLPALEALLKSLHYQYRLPGSVAQN